MYVVGTHSHRVAEANHNIFLGGKIRKFISKLSSNTYIIYLFLNGHMGPFVHVAVLQLKL